MSQQNKTLRWCWSAVVCMMGVAGAVPAIAAPTVEWAGPGQYRVLVEVPAIDLKDRDSDAMVAAWDVDWVKLLVDESVEGHINLASLTVHRYDPVTGQPMRWSKADTATTAESADPFARPVRFDDRVAIDDFPGGTVRPSTTPDGRIPLIARQRKARIFNRLVDPAAGRIVWSHLQEAGNPAFYAIYFDTTDSDRPQVSPARWIGDVDLLRRAEGESLGGFSHFTAAVGDLNADGLPDLVAGVEKGSLIWFPNVGRPGRPDFVGCHLMGDERGPIDTGFYGAPFVYDWDADGKADLLVGVSHDAIVWWRNISDGRPGEAPRLKYQGFITADGGRLTVPFSKVDGDDAGVFKRDYYNKPWVGDWDGDGLPDILTGGYVTGRISHYRGTARDADGVPELTYVGELEAGGEPIDTAWAAAPLACDFDHDGDMDLVTGSWWWSGLKRKQQPGETDYLMYYRNDGTAEDPRLTRAQLPVTGNFPRASITRPSAVDWNNDGLIDLLTTDSTADVKVFLNQGTPQQPEWSLRPIVLTAPWAFVRGVTFTDSWIDFDGDGKRETLNGRAIQRIEGTFDNPTLVPVGRVTVDGKPIEHPGPGYGDAYAFLTAADWDGDGLGDVLWGTQQGEVFLHRGTSGNQAPGGNSPAKASFNFAQGQRLTLTDGLPLKVGPEVFADPAEVKNFTDLQGSRIVLLVTDFDGDGLADLVVSETYGNIWVFLQTKLGGIDTLRPGVLVKKTKRRTGPIEPLDWNHDGRVDLLTTGSANLPGDIWLNESTPGNPALADAAHGLGLPYVFWGPKFRSVDWNGDDDDDIMINSEFLSFWAEGSFLAHGYRFATPIQGNAPDALLQRRGD